MLDIAIIGGGVCGLVLADRVHKRGQTWGLYEARPRLGGRVLSAPSARAGMDVDLGPTWYWPDAQPRITQLLADLALPTFAQHDEGMVLHLVDADKKAQEIGTDPIHGGARRVEGGMGRLVAALAARLPGDAIHLGHAVTAVRDKGDHVEVEMLAGGEPVVIEAKRVALALPPRLAAERIAFTPALAEDVLDAMRGAETWMAVTAKVVFGLDKPTWREAGRSGNAFVSHEQAVVGEVFDACDATGQKAALGGFLALGPQNRAAFAVGLPMLMGNQIAQLFGPELENGEQLYQDWAQEPWTCSERDLATPRAGEHVRVANPLFRRALWDGRLHLGGSETAAAEAGYLEGALVAAERIDEAVALEAAQEKRAAAMTETSASPGQPNAESVAAFAAWVDEQKQKAFDNYRDMLHRSLAMQMREQVTQRAMLEAVEQVFEKALGVLDGLAFDGRGVAVDHGRSDLTPQIQAPFGEFLRILMDDVIAYNRTSCALSNFPDEHNLSELYKQTIIRDIAAAWKEFSLAANRLLLAKTESSATS